MECEYQQDYTLPTWAIILICAVALLEIIAMWKVFTKAGQPGWAVIIPIYNIYIMTKIGGKPGIWTFILFNSYCKYYFFNLVIQHDIKKLWA